MAVTIHDVARVAGVSVATVSRALADPHLVRHSTRSRVLKVVEQLAYHPNPAARSLITGKTGTIGVIVPDIGNPFYPSILRGLQTRAHEAGFNVLLADSDEQAAAEVELVNTVAKQVDGVIICASLASDSQLQRLVPSLPVVLVNRRVKGIDGVLMNVADGVRQALDHLVALGHRRFAFLEGPREAWSNKERVRALSQEARRHSLRLETFGPFEPNFEGGIAATPAALRSGATAIIAYNDLMALGVLRELAIKDVRVPEAVSVVGVDDVLYAAMCGPPLTTVAMPMEAAGRAAVEVLLERIESQGTSRSRAERWLACDLIVRGSTAPPSY